MSREVLEYMLQMFTAQLKALLNVACKIADNACLMGIQIVVGGPDRKEPVALQSS